MNEITKSICIIDCIKVFKKNIFYDLNTNNLSSKVIFIGQRAREQNIPEVAFLQTKSLKTPKQISLTFHLDVYLFIYLR